MRKLVVLSVAILVAALSFVTTSNLRSALADKPVEGRAGRAEVRFLQGMIDHHQMALDMAGDCLKKAKTETVLKLCQAIIDAQTAEIKQLQGWLLTWYNIDYKAVSMLNMTGMESMDHSAMGMANVDPAGMMGMMAGLGRLEGTAYEIAWLESMIDHHDDALHMSNRVLPRAQHAELSDLAQKIIDAQTAEIARMEDLIKTLSA
jgi:uncharacterized protein (DUF305 family)